MKKQILSSFANPIFFLFSPLFTQCRINPFSACTRQDEPFTSQTWEPRLGMLCRGFAGWGRGESGVEVLMDPVLWLPNYHHLPEHAAPQTIPGMGRTLCNKSPRRRAGSAASKFKSLTCERGNDQNLN